MARKTRGALSIITNKTEVIPATPATAIIASAQEVGSLDVIYAAFSPIAGKV